MTCLTLEQSIPKLRELIPQTSHLTCTSRWQIQNGSLLSAWGGACIKFLYSGSTLNIRFGSKTQRKDRWNGGTRMLEVSVSGFQPDSKSTRKQSDESAQPDAAATATTRRYHLDAHPGLVFSVPLHRETFVVEIALIDWASIVEIDSFQTDESSTIKPFIDAEEPLSILVIGDSISCGFTTAEEEDHGDALPRGCLDAFPFKSKQILERTTGGAKLDIELVAYPGATLVGPTDDDSSSSDGASFSMLTKFMHTSPWSDQQWQSIINPKVIVIALGTNDESNDILFDHFTSTLKFFIQNLTTTFHSVKEIWLIPPFEDYSEEDRSQYRQSMLLLLESSSSNAVLAPSLQLSSAAADDVVPGVFICDIQDGMTEELTVDGLHPTASGQEILANNFANFVRERFEKLGDF